MDLGQRIATRRASFSLGLGAEAAPAARLRASARMGHNAARVIVKSEPIQWNFHYLLVTSFESHGLIWRRADESLGILAMNRRVEKVEIVHRVVTRGGVMGRQPMLLVNQARNQNHWLGVITKGTKSNRGGIGAKVTVLVAGHKFVQEVRSGSSYISNNHMRLHFGLGSSAEVIRIEVRWPNGTSEAFPGGIADRFVTLIEGQGQNPNAP